MDLDKCYNQSLFLSQRFNYLEKERVWFAISIKYRHNSNIPVVSHVNHVELHFKPIMESE
jgi:hypothetical protein